MHDTNIWVLARPRISFHSANGLCSLVGAARPAPSIGPRGPRAQRANSGPAYFLSYLPGLFPTLFFPGSFAGPSRPFSRLRFSHAVTRRMSNLTDPSAAAAAAAMQAKTDYMKANHNTLIYTISIVFAALSTICLSLRLIAKAMRKNPYTIDDWLLVAAWVCLSFSVNSALKVYQNVNSI